MKTFDEEKLERDFDKIEFEGCGTIYVQKNTSLSDRSVGVGFKLDTEYLKKHVPMISIIATDMPTPSSLYMAEAEREAIIIEYPSRPAKCKDCIYCGYFHPLKKNGEESRNYRHQTDRETHPTYRSSMR